MVLCVAEDTKQATTKRNSMIKLHGFSSSNYYNVPKLAMMEKGIEFEEVLAYTGFGPNYKPEYWTGRHWARSLPWKHPRALSASLVRFSTTLSALIQRRHCCRTRRLVRRRYKSYHSLLSCILSWWRAASSPTCCLAPRQIRQPLKNSIPRSRRLPWHWQNFPTSKYSPMATRSPLRISQRF